MSIKQCSRGNVYKDKQVVPAGSAQAGKLAGGEGMRMRRQVLNVEDVINIERRIAQSGGSLDGLMRRAGSALADAAIALFADLRKEGRADFAPLDVSGVCGACSLSRCAIRKSCGSGFPFDLPRVLVLAGTGNNGGDGWTAADTLVAAGCQVTLASPCTPEDLRAEPARSEALRVSGGFPVLIDLDAASLRKALLEVDLVIDAMLGVGFSGTEVREPLATWMRLLEEARHYGVLVVSADVPSGLDAQTGRCAHPCVRADVTVTMIACKKGLIRPSAARYVGEIVSANLGVRFDQFARLIPNPMPLYELEDYLARTYEPYSLERAAAHGSLPADQGGEGGRGESRAPRHKLAPDWFPTAALKSADGSTPPGASAASPAFGGAPAPCASAPAPCAPCEAVPCAQAPCDTAALEFDAVLEAPRQASLLDALEGLDAPFSVLLMELIDERGLSDVEVYKRAGMSRQLFSKIRSSHDYRPAKKTVLALAVALKLDLEETGQLLERAGFALSHSNKADVIVEYFIANERYDVMAINEALYRYDQPLL